MHFWPKFGNTDFNWWWLYARTSSKWGKFWLLSSIWPWSSRSIVPQNNRDFNQGLFHLWSKFGDSSLNGWWVIARTSWWLTDRHTHTHTHTQATTIPEGQNWPRVKKYFIHIAPKFGNWFGNVLCQMETTKNCPQYVNTVRPRQCDRHFTDNVFKLIQIAPNCIQTAPRFKNKFGSTLFQIEST